MANAQTREIAFEAAIEHHRTMSCGYVTGEWDSFDARRAIIPAMIRRDVD